MAEFAPFDAWRRVLQPLASFPDEDEPVAGTLHANLRCVRLDFAVLIDMYHAADVDGSFDDWRSVHLVRLREAVELIGFLLHHDKRAWEWFCDRDDFEFQADELTPQFEFTFHGGSRGDTVRDVDNGVQVLTGVDIADLGGGYHVAKQQLQEMYAYKYDPHYRVPVSFVQAPDKFIADVKKYCLFVRDFVRAIGALLPADPGMWFEFVSMKLYIRQLGNHESVVRLLNELRHSSIRILEVDLNVGDPCSIQGGKAANLLCGVGLTQDGAENGPIDEIVLHESQLEPFQHACTSLMEAKSPKRLCLYGTFGKKRVERATKWRWLGYALSGTHHSPSSIRHLRIEEGNLTATDMKSFPGASTESYLSPWASTQARKQCVRLAADAKVLLFDGRWYNLSDLDVSEASTFVVVDDTKRGEHVTVLVPGFGACDAHRSSVIDTFEPLLPSSRPISLLSLRCGINRCNPRALLRLTTTFGHSLVRLSLSLKNEAAFVQSDAEIFANAFPALEFLALDYVSLGSMDGLITAYETGRCRIEVLSMVDSFVEPASMTRFALRLEDPSSRVSQRLREFRYVLQDWVDDSIPEIISPDGAEAFISALETNRVLTVLDIGLVERVYGEFAARLRATDKIHFPEPLEMGFKLAFLSVFSRGASDTDRKSKKPRRSLPLLPVEAVRTILEFAPRRLTRNVKIISVE